MHGKTVSIRQAKMQLSRLVARAERGERIIIVRAGKPVAELHAAPKINRRPIPLADPLLQVDEYSYDGEIGPTANRDIDSTIVDF